MATRGRKPQRATDGPIPASGWATPDYLSDRARSEFERLVGILKTAGDITRTDPRLVELYAVNYDVLVTAQAVIKEQGMTVVSDRNNISPHPLLMTINQATIRLKGIIADLGLSPAAKAASGGGTSKREKEVQGWGDLIRTDE